MADLSRSESEALGALRGYLEGIRKRLAEIKQELAVG
jgi:hypothetical protein